MDLPADDTTAALTAKLEPAPSASEPGFLGSISTSQLHFHGPESPHGMGFSRRSCSFDCYCSCHSELDSTSQLSLNLRVTVFRVLTRPRRKCSVSACQRTAPPRIKKLVLPSASFCRALAILVSSRSWKMKYPLNTYRSIPENSDSITYVKHGDLENLKACIESGVATQFDTSPDGWSLLHVSQILRSQRGITYWLSRAQHIGAD
jgi:hypothetical protein